MIEFSRQSKNKMTLAGARAALTSTKVCAIIISVRVPTMEYGGSLNEVKEVIVHGIHNVQRLSALHRYADTGNNIVLSDLPKEEIVGT